MAFKAATRAPRHRRRRIFIIRCKSSSKLRRLHHKHRSHTIMNLQCCYLWMAAAAVRQIKLSSRPCNHSNSSHLLNKLKAHSRFNQSSNPRRNSNSHHLSSSNTLWSIASNVGRRFIRMRRKLAARLVALAARTIIIAIVVV